MGAIHDCCAILLIVLLPPLGILFVYDTGFSEFCICLILTIIGYIPGIIYALYVFFTHGKRHTLGPHATATY
eukprot:jgi/Chlat1/3888/Chrsp26S08859